MEVFRWISGGSWDDAGRDGSSEGSAVQQQPGFRRGLIYVVGFIALAAVPVLALNSLATADTTAASGYGTASEGAVPGGHRGLTDAQRQCLSEQGVTVPARPADGIRPALTPDQRSALRKAAEACGLPIRGRGFHRGFTDAQRQCLSEQGVTVPARPADGARPALTPEQRAALRKAAEACGLLRGPRGFRGVGDRATV